MSFSLTKIIPSSGASVIEKRNEMSIANTMVMESDAKNAPVTPPRNASGMWMTIVLAVEPIIAGIKPFNESDAVLENPNAHTALGSD